MEILARRVCVQHPDRPSLAVCMSCGNAICQECATQWEGINYCTTCLAALQKPATERSRNFALVAMILASLALIFAIVRLTVGMGAFIAGMF